VQCDQVYGRFDVPNFRQREEGSGEVAVFCCPPPGNDRLQLDFALITRKGTLMATYSPTELLNKWKRNELTAEQALGYLLQSFLTHSDRQTDIEARVRRLEQAVNANLGPRKQ